jgi:hypothetical protein
MTYYFDDQQGRWSRGPSRPGDDRRCSRYFAGKHEQEEQRLAATGYTLDNAPAELLCALAARDDLSGYRKPTIPAARAA